MEAWRISQQTMFGDLEGWREAWKRVTVIHQSCIALPEKLPYMCVYHTHTYVRLYINSTCLWYVYVIYIYMYLYLCVCICVYIYIYTHTPTEAWWCDGSGVPHLWDLTTLLPSQNLSEWIKLTSRIQGAAILAGQKLFRVGFDSCFFGLPESSFGVFELLACT